MTDQPTRGRLRLRLDGTEARDGIELVLVGTARTENIYLGAYDHHATGYTFHGLADGVRLLRWLEKAASRLRVSLEREGKVRPMRSTKRKAKP